MLFSLLLSSATHGIEISELTHAFLPQITEEDIHELKRLVLIALRNTDLNPIYIGPIFSILDIFSAKMDTNDINTIISFAHNKIKENDYEVIEQLASLLPTLWRSHKQFFVSDFFEAIHNTDLSHRSNALNTIQRYRLLF